MLCEYAENLIFPTGHRFIEHDARKLNHEATSDMFNRGLLGKAGVSLKNVGKAATDFFHPLKSSEQFGETLIPTKAPSGKECFLKRYLRGETSRGHKGNAVLIEVNGGNYG